MKPCPYLHKHAAAVTWEETPGRDKAVQGFQENLQIAVKLCSLSNMSLATQIEWKP